MAYLQQQSDMQHSLEHLQHNGNWLPVLMKSTHNFTQLLHLHNYKHTWIHHTTPPQYMQVHTCGLIATTPTCIATSKHTLDNLKACFSHPSIPNWATERQRCGRVYVCGLDFKLKFILENASLFTWQMKLICAEQLKEQQQQSSWSCNVNIQQTFYSRDKKVIFKNTSELRSTVRTFRRVGKRLLNQLLR